MIKIKQLINLTNPVKACYYDDEKDEIFIQHIILAGLDMEDRVRFIVPDQDGLSDFPEEDENFVGFWFGNEPPEKDFFKYKIKSRMK